MKKAKMIIYIECGIIQDIRYYGEDEPEVLVIDWDKDGIEDEKMALFPDMDGNLHSGVPTLWVADEINCENRDWIEKIFSVMDEE